MAKMKRQAKWDTCPHALFPFGKGMPLCSYGIKLSEATTAKDFPLCMKNNVCLKEQAEKESGHDESQ